jgi:hypothetical protein
LQFCLFPLPVLRLPNMAAVGTVAGVVFTVVAVEEVFMAAGVGACTRGAEVRLAAAGLFRLLRPAMGPQGALLLPRRVSGTASQIGKEIIIHDPAATFRTAMSALGILLRLPHLRQTADGIHLVVATKAPGADLAVHNLKLHHPTTGAASTFLAAIAARHLTAPVAVSRDRVAKSGRILQPLETWFQNPNRFPHFIILS